MKDAKTGAPRTSTPLIRLAKGGLFSGGLAFSG